MFTFNVGGNSATRSLRSRTSCKGGVVEEVCPVMDADILCNPKLRKGKEERLRRDDGVKEIMN